MDINWNILEQRYAFISEELARSELEQSKRLLLQKEFSQLSQVLGVKKSIDLLEQEKETARHQMKSMTDPAYAELFREELTRLEHEVVTQQMQLDELLSPPDPLANRSVYLEIRAGTGGQEAALFAGDLARMYSNYALKKGWRVNIESESPTDLGGYRELILHITGKQVYGNLKRESGVHRVQRIPTTETQGRVHTSTATVAVLPEAEEMDDVTINPADIRIDVFRASGAGGQHVNTTDSAVRITHIPTGIVVSCQDERSQHKNKAKALKMLQSRLLAAQLEAQHTERSKQRKEQVGTGERAEKVRTYNFPQNRVSDHQVDITLQKLDMVMQGDLDDLIEPLKALDVKERKEQFMNQLLANI